VKDFPPNLAFRQPWSRGRLQANLCAVLTVAIVVLGTPCLHSQTPVEPGSKSAPSSAASKNVAIKNVGIKIAAVKSFRIVQEKDGPAVEILATKPLVPSIQAISDPDRLVIDLPNARLDTQQKRISIQADQISAIRADQFQQNPPVARVVVDLLAPRAYTWDAAGNRLVVHLGKNPSQASSSPFQQPTVVSLTPAPQPVVAAVRAAGPLALAGNDNNNDAGSAITAGPDTAVLRLSSGGEVHVCPGTTVSVTPSQNRHNLMLSMNTGALEAHFALDASSDSVMTPDFRILLVGPGEFHYAISADTQGNTCVRALPGNTASAIVTELIGDRTYQVKATDQLMFRSGQLDRVDMAVPLECGCPPPRDAPLRATNDLPMQNQAQNAPPVNASPAAVAETTQAESAPSASLPATGVPAAAAPLDASVAPNELHVQVEAPFVFHATGPPPAPVEDVRALPLDSRPGATPPLAAPLPPSASENQKAADTETASANHAPARGFFKRLGGFFAALFR
jgi:AMIN domain-containing protein